MQDYAAEIQSTNSQIELLTNQLVQARRKCLQEEQNTQIYKKRVVELMRGREDLDNQIQKTLEDQAKAQEAHKEKFQLEVAAYQEKQKEQQQKQEAQLAITSEADEAKRVA